MFFWTSFWTRRRRAGNFFYCIFFFLYFVLVHWFFVCFSMHRLTLETKTIVFIADFSTFAFQWILFDKYDYTALAPIHFIQAMTSLVFTLTLLVVLLWNALLVLLNRWFATMQWNENYSYFNHKSQCQILNCVWFWSEASAQLCTK